MLENLNASFIYELRNDNALNENDLRNYIERIVNNLSDERKAKLLDEIDAYTIKIKNKSIIYDIF